MQQQVAEARWNSRSPGMSDLTLDDRPTSVTSTEQTVETVTTVHQPYEEGDRQHGQYVVGVFVIGGAAILAKHFAFVSTTMFNLAFVSLVVEFMLVCLLTGGAGLYFSLSKGMHDLSVNYSVLEMKLRSAAVGDRRSFKGGKAVVQPQELVFPGTVPQTGDAPPGELDSGEQAPKGEVQGKFVPTVEVAAMQEKVRTLENELTELRVEIDAERYDYKRTIKRLEGKLADAQTFPSPAPVQPSLQSQSAVPTGYGKGQAPARSAGSRGLSGSLSFRAPLPARSHLGSGKSSRSSEDSSASGVKDGIEYVQGRMLGKGSSEGCVVFEALNIDTGEFFAVKQQEYRHPKQHSRGQSIMSLNDGAFSGRNLTSVSFEEGAIPEEFHDLPLCQEANILSQLQHPNLIKILGTRHELYSDGDEADCISVFSLFEEIGDQGSLRAVIDRFGVLPDRVAISYTRQLASAVTYLHSMNIVHRDIKSDNMFVTAQGTIKLGDFGEATLIKPNQAEGGGRESSIAMSIHGSAYWMSPEVLSGKRYRKESDVWSIGCTVVEMLTGSPPYMSNGTGGFAAMCKLASEVHSLHRQFLESTEDVSPEARTFLTCCFQPRPLDRWSAEGLLNHPWLCGGNRHSPISQPQLAGSVRSQPPGTGFRWTPRKTGSSTSSQSPANSDTEAPTTSRPGGGRKWTHQRIDYYERGVDQGVHDEVPSPVRAHIPAIRVDARRSPNGAPDHPRAATDESITTGQGSRQTSGDAWGSRRVSPEAFEVLAETEPRAERSRNLPDSLSSSQSLRFRVIKGSGYQESFRRSDLQGSLASSSSFMGSTSEAEEMIEISYNSLLVSLKWLSAIRPIKHPNVYLKSALDLSLSSSRRPRKPGA